MTGHLYPALGEALERAAAAYSAALGVCPYPRGTVDDPHTCLCGQRVTFVELDPEAGDTFAGWAHDWWLDLRAQLVAELIDALHQLGAELTPTNERNPA